MMVREEVASDEPAIRTVIEAAFGRTQEARLVDQLRADGDAVLSLVADDAGRIVGHVLFSRMTAPFRALGLAPVSVAPDCQRAGIGDRMIRVGLERAADAGWQGVFVLGDPAYYRRFGFDVERAAGFASPYAGPYLMVRTLGGPLPVAVGRIEYAPAFASLE